MGSSNLAIVRRPNEHKNNKKYLEQPGFKGDAY